MSAQGVRGVPRAATLQLALFYGIPELILTTTYPFEPVLGFIENLSPHSMDRIHRVYDMTALKCAYILADGHYFDF